MRQHRHLLAREPANSIPDRPYRQGCKPEQILVRMIAVKKACLRTSQLNSVAQRALPQRGISDLYEGVHPGVIAVDLCRISQVSA
jgi:hypothetical protein